MTNLTKLRVSDYKRGITKWGADTIIEVSFQKFPNSYACFQGDGSVSKIMGWGETKKLASQNLIDNLVKYGGLSF